MVESKPLFFCPFKLLQAAPQKNIQTDYLIIGAGIQGLITAFYLLEKNRRVTIIDKNRAGSGASWAGGGILSPLYPWRYNHAVQALALQSVDLYRPIIEKLRRHFEQKSTIHPALKLVKSGLRIADLIDFESAKAWLQENNVDYQDFTQSGKSGLYLEHIYQIENPVLLKALSEYLIDLGATVYEMSEEHSRDFDVNLSILKTPKGLVHCHYQTKILATGAWSSKVAGIPLGIEPVKGQMVCFAKNPESRCEITLDNGFYLIPRLDGKILAGSTIEFAEFDTRPNQAGYEKLLKKAFRQYPALKNVPIFAQWSGLRPGSVDGVPTIAAHPVWQNVYINAGHFRNGLTLAPASAKYLIDHVIPGEDDCNPFALKHASDEHIRPIISDPDKILKPKRIKS